VNAQLNAQLMSKECAQGYHVQSRTCLQPLFSNFCKVPSGVSVLGVLCRKKALLYTYHIQYLSSYHIRVL